MPQVIEALRERHITLISGGWRHTMAADDTGQLLGWGWNRVRTPRGLNALDAGCAGSPLPIRQQLIGLAAECWHGTQCSDDMFSRVLPVSRVKPACAAAASPSQSDIPHLMLHAEAHCPAQFGQLGLGTTEDASTPALLDQVATGPFRELACGWRHSMAVTQQGVVYSWGRGVSGQLGHGDCADA